MPVWIKPNLNIDWVGKRRYFYVASGSAVLLSAAVLLFNTLVRGSALNYGTDFAGGSEIIVEFYRSIETEHVRAALEKAGFTGGNVVKITDTSRPNLYMIRVREVTAFSPAEQEKVKKALEKAFPGKLTQFEYKSGGDKIYLRFRQGTKVEPKEIEEAIAATQTDIQQVQPFGKPEDKVFEVILSGLDRDIRRIFGSAMGKDIVRDVPQVEAVGPKMGKQLREDGIKSVIYALLLILLYVALRFDFRYSPGGVVALAHDVFITTGLLAVTWTEFSMTAIAALLTLAGYSINDTIVIYDRIREDVPKYRDRKFSQVVNAAINETMSRTLLTSFATLLSVAPMWILGSGDVYIFGITFTFGIFIGCYSTVAIATPLVLFFTNLVSKKAVR